MKLKKEQKQYLVKVSLVFIFLILLFEMVSAELPKLRPNTVSVSSVSELASPITKGQAANLIQTCDNCTGVNVTKITFPNSSIALLGNFPMTKNGTEYNFTFTATNTLGTHTYTTCGDLNGVLTCDPVLFKVTNTGNELNTAQGILYFLICLVLILLFCLCIYGGMVIPFNNQRNTNQEVISINWRKYLNIFCWGFSYTLLIGIVFVIWNLIYAYSDWQNLGKFFQYLYRLLMALALPTLIGIWLMVIVNYINDKKIESFIKRTGLPYNG